MALVVTTRTVCDRCSTEVPSGRRVCDECKRARERDRDRRRAAAGREFIRARAALCAGVCGRMLGGGGKSLPAGQRICLECRRARRMRACANEHCDVLVKAPKQFCSRACRPSAVGDPLVARRRRDARKNAKRRPHPRAGAAWQRLRLQVLAEEPDCWICGDAIDPALSGLHPMGGTGDHVVPVEDGGALLDRGNVRAAHRLCNQRRHVLWMQARRAAARGA